MAGEVGDEIADSLWGAGARREAGVGNRGGPPLGCSYKDGAKMAASSWGGGLHRRIPFLDAEDGAGTCNSKAHATDDPPRPSRGTTAQARLASEAGCGAPQAPACNSWPSKPSFAPMDLRRGQKAGNQARPRTGQRIREDRGSGALPTPVSGHLAEGRSPSLE